MSLAIGVMAHISRIDQANQLFQVVDADVISIDRGDLGENPNGDRTWRMLAGADTEWSIVLQDDAIVTFDFREHAETALAYAPYGPVSFYVGTGQPHDGLVKHAVLRADQTGAHWLEDRGMHWGVAIAMPTDAIRDFLTWGEKSAVRYDRRIGDYWRERGVSTRYTWPSLVDHADGDTIAHRRQPGVKRVARRVGSRLGWDGPVVQIGAVSALLGHRVPE